MTKDREERELARLREMTRTVRGDEVPPDEGELPSFSNPPDWSHLKPNEIMQLRFLAGAIAGKLSRRKNTK